MKGRSPTFTQLPLDVVGSTRFGRYPKISQEQTFNMIISDGFLVPYAGHLQVATVAPQQDGRGIFTSVRLNSMVVVIGNMAYLVSPDIEVTTIGQLNTSTGTVYIDENLNGQIVICDQFFLYVYNYATPTTPALQVITPATLGFTPGYITMQNNRIVAAGKGTSNWNLSALGDATSWPGTAAFVGALQTKPDYVQAVQRFPGRGNLLYVMGTTVSEPWQDIGAALFPYQKNSSVNIDYGCLSPATIAYNENYIVWLATNEKSGPFIAYSTGGDIQRISTDGIDFKFTTLTNPSNSYGFLFRQDGHLIYQITFPDDALTYSYDFNTKKFFTITDENQNAHIAKRVAFFNNTYYFVSFVDGNIYEMSTKYSTYNGVEIPRIRICRNIRMPDASRFAVNNLTFTLESGTQQQIIESDDLMTESGEDILTDTLQTIMVNSPFNYYVAEPIMTDAGDNILTDNLTDLDANVLSDQPYIVPQSVGLSVSKDGGLNFGAVKIKDLPPQGNTRNRLIYWQLGAANDFVPMFQFWGLSRFVVTDGIASVYQ